MPDLPLLQRRRFARIAIFRALHLGDMLCAVPALRALRQAQPQAHICLIGLPWARQFATRYPAYLNGFLPFPGAAGLPEQAMRPAALAAFFNCVRRQQFDLALQLHGSGAISNQVLAQFGARWQAGCFPAGARPCPDWEGIPYPGQGSEAERLLALLEHLGAPGSATPEFPLSAADMAELQASGLAQNLQPGSYVCLHPGARDPEKCWPPACFAAVGDFLAERYRLQVLITGGPGEAALAAVVAGLMRSPARQAAGPVSLGALALLLRGARLLVSNDTGVAHLAAALALPRIIVFSKADMGRWSPPASSPQHCLWDADAQRLPEVCHAAAAMLAQATSP